MHLSIRSIIGGLIALLPVAGSGQITDTNSLATQIREQEKTVEVSPGKSDGEAWLKLAILRQDAAQYRDSERAYRKSIALLTSGNRDVLADALDQMGTMYVECGQLSKAEPLERQALAIREERKDPVGMGVSHTHLAMLLLGRHENAAAEVEGKIAVSLLVPEQQGHSSRLATPEEQMTALIDLSLARCAGQDCAAAIPDLRHALGIAHANYEENSIPVGFLDFLLGYAYWKSGDDESAEGLMRKGTQELSTQLGWGHPTYVKALKQYRNFLRETGHPGEADEIGAKIDKLERSPGMLQANSNDPSTGLDQLH